MKRQYRTRPLRGKNKAHTISEPATLLDWLTCYPMMTVNPRAWFCNWSIPETEIRQVYEAGYRATALALGYRPFAERRPQNVDILHQPIVCSVGKVA